MANIGTQPTAAELLETEQRRGAYGDHLVFERDELGSITLKTTDNIALAQARADQAKVEIETVNGLENPPLVMPYLNAFISHSNQRVEKYWRTKLYRVVQIDKALAPKDEVDVAARIPVNGHVLGPVSGPAQLRSLAQLLVQAADALEKEQRAG
jgi:hypothetical protein